MRTTVNLSDDAFLAAKSVAQRRRVSLGEAISVLIRQGAAAGEHTRQEQSQPALRGRFALLPARDEVITPQHVRELLEQRKT